MLSPAPPSCVCVHGVLRSSENPSSFVPPNAGREFFWIDVPALAAAAGLPASTPLVEVIRGAGDAVQPPATYPVVRWAAARRGARSEPPMHSAAGGDVAAAIHRDAGRPPQLRSHLADSGGSDGVLESPCCGWTRAGAEMSAHCQYSRRAFSRLTILCSARERCISGRTMRASKHVCIHTPNQKPTSAG